MRFLHIIAILSLSCDILDFKVQILFPWWLQCGEAFSYIPKMLYAISPELKPFFRATREAKGLSSSVGELWRYIEKKLIDRLPSSDIIWDLIWDSWGPSELVQPSLKRLK